ncbi:hypothetical protein M3P36_05345 [Altererythrobacter sp. KTW20L]|uniref:hypothetical protein n=1 Tax=Altererythrobacter sp. KTW20L TaxID=2942210 RepID=UPI0020BF2D1B|nr:hypothetical protein [Altererythrobacter sp. KTW20L]MCL6250468.1 hypothetical protein [Altererythrobacter sp. KTW20L]
MAIANRPARRSGHLASVAIPLAGLLALFLGAFLSDWAYYRTEHIQWINFAAWLNAGAMVLTGIALATSIIAAVFSRRSWRGWWLVVALVAATFVLGLFGAFVHARDAFATMPDGLVLSLLTLAVAIAANWAAFSRGFRGDWR